MKRITMLVAAVAMTLGMMAAPAMAAKPASQGCLGHDMSAAGQTHGAEHGAFVSDVATNGPGGAGFEIQLHLAGQVPDDVTHNTCNDDTLTD